MYDKLTKNDIKNMEAEIEHRTLVQRKELIEAVKEAREHGDLSENFEYYASRREKNQNESRIAYLKRMINTAHIIDDSSKDDEVGINNTVELFFEEQNMVKNLTIVTNVRGNSLENKVSLESPIGKALIGKKQGDRVKVSVNDNFSYYVVINRIIKDLPDDIDKINSF